LVRLFTVPFLKRFRYNLQNLVNETHGRDVVIDWNGRSMPRVCRTIQITLLLSALLLMSASGQGQAPSARTAAAPRPRRTATAKFTDQKITIDGKLDEPAWQTAEVSVGFTQQDPTEGVPSTQLTEVRILYDKNNLYFGIFCHDTDPAGIIINDISHDFDHLQEDYLTVHLDPFHDRSNGYAFTTTAMGGEEDSQFTDEGRVNNMNWDGVWYVESRRNDDGWIAEYAIPFKTLRFSEARQQVWGLNFIRRIRRYNESTYWSIPPRRYGATRSIPYAGDLLGIEDVEPSKNFQLKPYGLTGVKRFESQGKDTEKQLEGGLDVKYGVTPGLSLDLTVNTDFSEVDADTQQINLTRFSTFFPEKREFFLENSGLFQLGTLTKTEGLLFQSRTIGLQNGNPIPILGGVRLTGHAGKNYLGVLNMQTRSKDAIPATNFTVARLKRTILRASNVGLMFLNQQSRLPNDYNRAIGADTNLLFPRPDLRISGALARTITPGLTGNDRIGKVEADLQSNLFRYFGSYVDVGRDFNPEMGFVQRTGRRYIHEEVSARPRFRPQSRVGHFKILDVVGTMSLDQVLFSAGGTEEKTWKPSINVTFISGSTLAWNFTNTFERIVKPFGVPGVNDAGRNVSLTVPVGDYRSDRHTFTFTSDRSRRFSGNLGYNRGDYYGGNRTEYTAGATYHYKYRFTAAVTYDRNNVNLPKGSLHTDLSTLNLDYSFSAKMFLSAFIQYNSQNNQISSNYRFRLIHHPLSDIFVVYNDVRDRIKDKKDRSLTLKYTRLFSF
jgi:uncharacterized protein DUF5916/cellulose/xylan binding protein with CBM9 domain